MGDLHEIRILDSVNSLFVRLREKLNSIYSSNGVKFSFPSREVNAILEDEQKATVAEIRKDIEKVEKAIEEIRNNGNGT